LFVTTASFFLFTVALWFGAMLSNSLALTADAIAMSVDVVTYFVNMFAETLKTNANGGVLSAHTRFKLEVYVPVVSCLALLASGLWIAWSAYVVLVPPEGQEEGDEAEDVNIATLYAFSSVNFMVDLLSVWMFYRKGKSVFENENQQHHAQLKTIEVDMPADGGGEEAGQAEGGGSVAKARAGQFAEKEPAQKEEPEAVQPKSSKNVNMMSAFLHVGADTIRTFAVFAAAAAATSGQDGAKCDAWAAEVCTLTVLIMIVPVVKEIRKSAAILLPLMREEVLAAEQQEQGQGHEMKSVQLLGGVEKS
jgi:cation diffusion facilitator family transporter